ncbi:hypothetical protein GPNCGGLF_LOCUS300 [Methylorubrum aminovorans]
MGRISFAETPAGLEQNLLYERRPGDVVIVEQLSGADKCGEELTR